MSENDHPALSVKFSLINNWISLLGVILAVSSLFATLCLIILDFIRGFSSVYMGVLTYLIVPGFLWFGIFLIGLGFWYERRRHKKDGARSFPIIDLNLARHRRYLILISSGVFFFLLLSALGSFSAFHVTESVPFCGALCHQVMEPEYAAYNNSPHARVPCTECHIGPSTSWFVRSKISGLYQVFATLTNSYPRPIPTPIEDLRPVAATCRECHWPEKFAGDIDLHHAHFLPDEENSPWTIRTLLKVGGADPAHGPVGGIHWHMIVANRVEYIAADEQRQVIPWVRITNLDEGTQTVYVSKEKNSSPDLKNEEIRTMDCVDCHNRPTHNFSSPNQALNVSLWLERINTSIPYIKYNAAQALVNSAEAVSQTQGIEQIEEELSKEYKDSQDQEAIREAIFETQRIYRNNFFPKMKTNWQVRPDNIGHHIWPGCFRCHDGQHINSDGEVVSKACDSCHIIIAQGPGLKPESTNLDGLKFEHPGGELPEDSLCHDCHTGAP